MLKKIIAATTLAGALGALAIVYLTTPATIHPIGLLVFFICVYAVVLGGVAALLFGLQHLYKQIAPRQHTPVTLVGAYEYATVIALGPVILLALQTVGRVRLIDVLLTTIFVILGCFYVSRRR